MPPCHGASTAALQAASAPAAPPSLLNFAMETDAGLRPRRLLASWTEGHRNGSSVASREHRHHSALASVSARHAGVPPAAGGEEEGRAAAKRLEPLPVGLVEGSAKKPYVWDEDQGRLRAIDPRDIEQGEHYGRTLQGHIQRVLHDLKTAFLPEPQNVTPDYWEYARWKAVHRVFSSMESVFATQSLLRAVGVGAKRSLPAAAAINWVLKDGLGRLGRLTVAARFGESFDSDLKRFRFTTSVLYCTALGLEYLTPIFPQHFLVMASVANVGKAVGLTTFIATQPAFHRSFARGENLADISAKAQAQQMVMDNIGLATAVALTHVCSCHQTARWALPFVAFPILAVGDLYSIYRELRAIHLRTLNKERAEIIAEYWLRTGRVPTPLQVSSEERLILPPRIAHGCLPLRIGSLHDAVRSRADLQQLLENGREERYVLTYEPPCQTDTNSIGSSGGSSGGSSSRQQQSSGGSSSRQQQSSGSSSRKESISAESDGGWWQHLMAQLRGSSGRGCVQVALRRDAEHDDILEAILQAAYLRQALRSPAALPSSSSSSIGSGGDSTADGSRRSSDNGSNRRSSSSSLQLTAPQRPGLGSSNSSSGGFDATRGSRSSGDSEGRSAQGGVGAGEREDCCQSCVDADREQVLLESKRRAHASLQPFIHQLQQGGWQVAPFMLSSTEKHGYVMMGG